MGGLFSSKETHTVSGRELTPQELELIEAQTVLANQQLAAVRRLRTIGGELSPASIHVSLREQKDILRGERRAEDRLRDAGLDTAAIRAARVAEDEAGILPELLEQIHASRRKISEDVARGQTASPEDLAAIERASEAAIEAGLTDIERFQTQGLEQLRNVLAPARGLRPSDSPIFERGGDVVAEATRQAGQLFQTVRGQAAQQELAFPLARRAADLSAIGLQANMFDASRQFQQQLRQQSFLNRLTLGSALGDMGLAGAQFQQGVASGIPANIGSALAAVAGAQGQRSTARGRPGLGQVIGTVGKAAGGAGGLMQGISMVAGGG